MRLPCVYTVKRASAFPSNLEGMVSSTCHIPHTSPEEYPQLLMAGEDTRMILIFFKMHYISEGVQHLSSFVQCERFLWGDRLMLMASVSGACLGTGLDRIQECLRESTIIAREEKTVVPFSPLKCPTWT